MKIVKKNHMGKSLYSTRLFIDGKSAFTSNYHVHNNLYSSKTDNLQNEYRGGHEETVDKQENCHNRSTSEFHSLQF